MKTLIFISIFCFTNLYGQSKVNEYLVLHLSGKAITSNGEIDYTRWVNFDFPWSFAVNVWEKNERRCFYPVENLFFEVSSEIMIGELRKRFEVEANITSHLSVKSGKIYYKNRKLNYNARIKTSIKFFWKNSDNPIIQGFAFSKYLIFMVETLDASEDGGFHLVVYNLENDTFAVYPTHGSWPQVWLFRRDEAVPDPRPVSGNSQKN